MGSSQDSAVLSGSLVGHVPGPLHVKLHSFFEWNGLLLREIALGVPTRDDIAEFGLELSKRTVDADGVLCVQMDLNQVAAWLCRLTGFPHEMMRAFPLSDGKTLVEALKIQLARSAHLATTH